MRLAELREAPRGDSAAPKVYPLLYFLNVVVIAYQASIIFFTVYRICDDDRAFAFLKMAKCLPAVPWTVPVLACGLFFAVGGLSALQRLVRARQWLVFAVYIADLALCCWIAYELNLSYKGFFLFLIAEAFLNIQALPLRIASFLMTGAVYVAFDYDFANVVMKMVSFHDYLDYYGPQTQLLLYGAKTTLESINLILVIVFFYQLIQGKIRENKEFIELNAELERNLEAMRRMTAENEEAARIKERNRLAHDIHDILGHSLTCIDTGLEASLALAADADAGLVEQLKKVKRFAGIGLSDIRRSVRALGKDAIQNQSLIEALEELVGDINSARVRRASLEIEGEPVPLDYDERQAVYRIVQESITNSINHGEAANIGIRLSFRAQELELRTADDGKGCASISPNFGLSHMEEQAAMLGGRVEFDSAEGRGFSVRAVLPIRRHPE
jgi:signal transduction histidine kinase